jgi:uncharacterized Zn finger protein (UPF0148 family)
MNKLISDTDIPDIKCPNCGKPLGESFGRLKNVKTVRCRTCDGIVDTSKATAVLRKNQEALRQLDARLKKTANKLSRLG